MLSKATMDLFQDQPGRILVCDDNPVNCAMAEQLLSRRGFGVTSVGSGEDAIALLARNSFDAVLLDIELPGINGLDVTRHLRSALPSQAYLPIILVTGQTGSEMRLQGLQAGASDFITKPFDPHELVARVTNFVSAKRVYDRLVALNTALEEEREKVVRVQKGLLPKEFPKHPKLRFSALYRPSKSAGGDYYDVIQRENGSILLAIGDVSGHGIPSAMHMSVLRAVLHAEAHKEHSVEKIMAVLNQTLQYALNEYTFVTFYLAEFDPATRLLCQVSAGHPLPLLVNPETESVRELSAPAHYPLGVEPESAFASEVIEIPPGHRLVLYTDGILEQMNTAELFFGRERFESSLLMGATLSTEKAPAFVLDQLQIFSQTQPIQDDITLLMMDIKP